MTDFNNLDLGSMNASPIDTTGDGVMDSWAADSNGDGVPDVVLSDTNGDGALDMVQTTFDTTGDGVGDTLVTTLGTNHDGVGDVTIVANETTATHLMDTDHNGVFDQSVTISDFDRDGNPDHIAKSSDYNQDGFADSFQVVAKSDVGGPFDMSIRMRDTTGDGVLDERLTQIDADGDGRADFIQRERLTDVDSTGQYHTKVVDVDADGDGVFEQVGEKMAAEDGDQRVAMTGLPGLMISGDDGESVSATELGTFDPSLSDMEKVIGDPVPAMEKWECQGSTNRCGLYAQKFVIEEFTGKDIDMGEYLRIAKVNGLFGEGEGTAALNMNKMLDQYGIKNEMSFHNSLEDIEASLARGERVIVSIDADEIWHGEKDNVFTPFDAEGLDSANHAVEVIGIDKTDPDNPMVILNDSGTPDGRGELVPADIFCDAWDDGNCQMIRCIA